MMKILGSIFLMGAALYAGQPDISEAGNIRRMVPMRAVDIYNDTRIERVIIVRTVSGREILFSKAVSPAIPEPMFVRPDYLPCNTRFEASLDGKKFQPIRGDICAENETDDPLILRMAENAQPELIPVDPD